jgi:hypothetical protein
LFRRFLLFVGLFGPLILDKRDDASLQERKMAVQLPSMVANTHSLKMYPGAPIARQTLFSLVSLLSRVVVFLFTVTCDVDWTHCTKESFLAVWQTFVSRVHVRRFKPRWRNERMNLMDCVGSTCSLPNCLLSASTSIASSIPWTAAVFSVMPGASMFLEDSPVCALIPTHHAKPLPWIMKVSITADFGRSNRLNSLTASSEIRLESIWKSHTDLT